MLPSVSGIGVQLHFNFQFFLIVWALAIGVAWLFLALSVDDALLILAAGVPRSHLGKDRPQCTTNFCGKEETMGPPNRMPL